MESRCYPYKYLIMVVHKELSITNHLVLSLTVMNTEFYVNIFSIIKNTL